MPTRPPEAASSAGSVLVVGGSGFFGRTVVEDLLARTGAAVVVGGRRRRVPFRHPRLSWAPFDLRRPGPLDGYSVVVCGAGPFQGMPTTLVEAAARAGVPYVDLADDRDFLARARAVRSPAPVLAGLSIVPGLTCLLAGRGGVGRLLRVRTLIAPGSRPPRGEATLASLLSGLDRWGARERVRFPAPVGWRAVYRAIEVGDHDLVPALFGGAAFEFKVGFDLDLFNRGLELLRFLRTRRLLPDPLRLRAPLGALVRALSPAGTDAGAVRVEAEGAEGTYAGTVVAPRQGHRLPGMLAAVAAARILEGRLETDRLDRWLPDAPEEFARRGLRFLELRRP